MVGERRKNPRLGLAIPVRVEGFLAGGESWQELASTTDVSSGGACFGLSHPVELGQVLLLSLALPKRLFRHPMRLVDGVLTELVPQAIIFRPSIVFGPEDDFFNRFAALARLSPALPLIGGGKTKFQPVFVGDVAKAVIAAEFPELASRVNIQLPDEKSRRVGQSIAAASLPALARTGV